MPDASPPSPGARPVASASVVVDVECLRRLARATTFTSGRVMLVVLVAVVPALLAGTIPSEAWTHTMTRVRPGLTALVFAAVFLVALGLGLLAVRLVAAPRTLRRYTTAMPLGSTLRVEYWADRMVVESSGGADEPVRYDSIRRVRVKDRVVVHERGLNAAALPVEVVPDTALRLLRDGSRARSAAKRPPR